VAVVAFGVSLAAVLSLGGMDGQAASSGSPPVPGSSSTKVAPAKVGLDAAKLNQIAATAKKGKSSCLVAVRNGKLAGEWYFKGTGPDSEQDVFSVTKSFASTLVGIAQDEGKLRIGSSASTWIPEWKGTPSEAVAVRDLLSMDSGRQWSFQSDYVQLLRASDRTAYAIGLGQSAPPGTVWAYNNAGVFSSVACARTSSSVCTAPATRSCSTGSTRRVATSRASAC
jgi:CubicO group peptidase (beta-lactamase class C family)